MLKRCYTTLIPTAATTYLSTHLNPADLYGSFWTLTTLVFALFLSSSLGASIAKYLSTNGTPYDYNFQLLSIAVSLVYTYGLVLPILLWLALRYLGVGEWSIVEAVAVWGYGQFVWIPVSVSESNLFNNILYSPFLCRYFALFPCQSCVGHSSALRLVSPVGSWPQIYIPFSQR